MRTRPLRSLLLDSLAGLLAGVLAVVVSTSAAVLIYAGPLEPFAGRGVALALISTVAAGAVVALRSSLVGVVALVVPAPAALMALATAGVSAAMPAGAAPAELFATATVANGLAVLAAALTLLALGTFRLGRLVRYLPYPVVGGFLAGTGWLLVVGGVGVMVDLPAGPAAFGALVDPAALLRWLPGIALAAVLLLALERSDAPWVWPAALGVAGALFYAVFAASGAPAAEWRAAGLLPGPFPEGPLLRPFDYRELARVHWGVVLAAAGDAVSIVVVAVLGVLFNATGIELLDDARADLDRELRAAGLANALTGAAGGMVGHHAVGLSTLAHRVSGGGRGAALAAVGVVAATLLLGATLLAWIPTLVLGGLLVYLGLGFLRQWAIDARRTLPRFEYAIVLLILGVIVAAGFLWGIGAGLVAALGLFVVRYSRTDVVRHELDGRTCRSRVTRSERAERELDAAGDATRVLELQGFVFFGTASGLLERIETRLAESPAIRFVLLDFARVTGVDATALLTFEKLRRTARERGISVGLSAMAPRLARQLGRPSGDALRAFPTLDAALEWCEEQVLAAAGVAAAAESESATERFGELLGDADLAPRVLAYFERRELDAGTRFVRQGDPPDALWFVASGSVSALLERDGEPLRLETMAGGSLVGELGFYTGAPRSASVVTDEPAVVYRLTRAAVERMTAEQPALAATFQALVVRLLARRTGHLIRVVASLQR